METTPAVLSRPLTFTDLSQESGPCGRDEKCARAILSTTLMKPGQAVHTAELADIDEVTADTTALSLSPQSRLHCNAPRCGMPDATDLTIPRHVKDHTP